MFQAPGDPVALAVQLVNTWDTLEDPHELLRDVAVLRRLLGDHGLAAYADRASAADVARVRRLRGRLREAFEAPDEGRAVAALNEIVGKARARPQLVRDGSGWTFQYAGSDVTDTLAANVAASLLEAIRDDGWERFGRCAGSPCCCVFVDRSRNRSRRFCSSLCADRVAAAAYRSRRRTA